MGEGLKQMYDEVSSSRAEEDYDELGSLSQESDIDDDDDASPKNSERSLDQQLSSLTSQLPIKKGLSKYYKGKSQSFSSFTDLGCVEDLAKKETPYKKKIMIMQSCRRSYAGGLNQEMYGPAAEAAAGTRNNNIPSKASTPRGNLACSSSLMARTASGSSFFSSAKPPHIPMQKNI